MLDKKNGVLEIGNLSINPESFSIVKLAEHKNIEIIERKFDNGYAIISVPNVDNGRYSMSISTYGEKILWVSISLGISHDIKPFENNSFEKDEIISLLSKLGGDFKYKWGEVELINDKRNNSFSIMVKYN